jgi:hypothetical protein
MLDDQGSIPGIASMYFLLHHVMTDDRSYPAFYRVVRRGSFLRGEAAEVYTDHHQPLKAKVLLSKVSLSLPHLS